ncbi:MAG TPA: TOMM precursor leader peptide-binding protein, partial [Longimicrobium sp.]|nr:TOMM precursor leader peptide-binding protein [Longimicrobium sp.]
MSVDLLRSPTLARPQLRQNLVPVVVGEDTAMLVHEDEHALLRGRAYPRLLPLLDGSRTIADLVGVLSAELPPPECLFAIHVLYREGHLVEADPGPRELTAFWHERGARLADAEHALAQASLSVTALDGEPGDEVAEALRAGGLRVVEGPSSLDVVVARDYQSTGLAAINERMLAAGRPWMLMKLNGRVPWIGPLFEPGTTGCWQCLAQRLQANRQLQGFLQRKLDRQDPLSLAWSRHPAVVQAATAIAATEITRFLATGESRLSGRIVSLDMSTLETAHHLLTRRPQCPACGDADLLRRPRRLVLAAAPKQFVGDGGHRAVSPEATYERYAHHVSPLTGVVTSLTRFDKQAQNGLTYCYSAGHNFAMVQDDAYYLTVTLRNRSGGKGCTEAQAKVSAISEAIERYSGVWRGDEAVRHGRMADFAPGEALHPNAMMGFSERQYAGRAAINAAHSRFDRVPRPFDPERAIDWTAAWSLTAGEFRYVPSSYCYFGHPEFHSASFCYADSNGNAAGNTLEEAILQGFMELVERDAVAIWWYNRVRRPRVDLDSFNDPYVRALQGCYRDMGREFWVIDITSDLPIPTYAAVSRRIDRPVEDILVGFGAHFDPRVALLRALTEINQFLPCVSETSDSGETIYWFYDREA